MLGFGATGQFAIGEVGTGAASVAEFIGPDKWMRQLSEPVRFLAGVNASAQQFAAFNSQPIVSFSWFGALTEPVRQKPGLLTGAQQFFTTDTSAIPISNLTPWFAALSEPVRAMPLLPAGEQQFLAFYPLPLVSFSWFNELSKPQKLERVGLAPAYQQTLALHPNPLVSFSWFEGLSEPVRNKPGLPAALYPFFAIDPTFIPSPSKLLEGWFSALSEPVRMKLGLSAPLQQFYAAPPRLMPKPNLIGVLSALETKDVFLGGISAWNRVISGEIGLIEQNFSGAVGVVEKAASSGTSGVVELAAAPASGSAVPAITSAHISIRII